MGQYHYVVNLSKRQFIHPHKLGNGLKLLEQAGSSVGTGAALLLLAAVSNGRGGGDAIDTDDCLIGSWGGDRIAVVGDYAEKGDLPQEDEAENIYDYCIMEEAIARGDIDTISIYVRDGHDLSKAYADITDAVADLLELNLEGIFVGSGWRHWIDLSIVPGFHYSHKIGQARAANINGKNYWLSSIRDELRRIIDANPTLAYHEDQLKTSIKIENFEEAVA